MERITYVIIAEDLVWLFIYESHNDRGFKELLGKAARDFIAGKKQEREETVQASQPKFI